MSSTGAAMPPVTMMPASTGPSDRRSSASARRAPAHERHHREERAEVEQPGQELRTDVVEQELRDRGARTEENRREQPDRIAGARPLHTKTVATRLHARAACTSRRRRPVASVAARWLTRSSSGSTSGAVIWIGCEFASTTVPSRSEFARTGSTTTARAPEVRSDSVPTKPRPVVSPAV